MTWLAWTAGLGAKQRWELLAWCRAMSLAPLLEVAASLADAIQPGIAGVVIWSPTLALGVGEADALASRIEQSGGVLVIMRPARIPPPDPTPTRPSPGVGAEGVRRRQPQDGNGRMVTLDKWSPERGQKVRELLAQGASMRQIRRLTGAAYTTIRRIRDEP